MNKAIEASPASTIVPAQRDTMERTRLSVRELVVQVSDMLMLIQDEISGGVAGQDAADLVTHNEGSLYSASALMRIFRQSQATPGTRLARYVDNVVSAVEALDFLTSEGR